MKRMRRLRSSNAIRKLVQETHLNVEQLVYPVFVIEGDNIKNPVDSMPGIYQYSIDRLGEECDRMMERGVHNLLIFGIPAHKDEAGSQAYDENGITQRAIRYLKKTYPEIFVIADVCLCEYTSHGHCGLVQGERILNDETLPLLVKMSVSLAEAGADMIAPSDMMDGSGKDWILPDLSIYRFWPTVPNTLPAIILLFGMRHIRRPVLGTGEATRWIPTM